METMTENKMENKRYPTDLVQQMALCFVDHPVRAI